MIGNRMSKARGLLAALLVVASARVAPADDSRPLEATKKEDVGNKKSVEVKATLYRNGPLVVEQHGRNSHWTEGLRPRTFVVVAAGPNAIWVSQVKAGPTCGSKSDPTTPSNRKRVFDPENIPAVVAQAATRIDIYSYDGDRATSLRDQWVGNIKQTVKDAKDISAEVKKAVLELK